MEKAAFESVGQASSSGIVCPSCGSTNKTTSKFCGYCGTLLSPSQTNPAPESTVPTASSAELQVGNPKPSQGKMASVFEPIEKSPEAEKSVETSVSEPQKENSKSKSSSAFASFSFLPVEDVSQEGPEPELVFAQGLPSWDLVPPQVVIRQRRRV